MMIRHLPVAAACVAATLMLAACGSGSGSAPAAADAPVTLGGTAATGAAFDNASITVTDRTGTIVGTGSSATDGSYTITLAANAIGPFVVQAVRDGETLVSVAPNSGGTVNITPITHLIAARLSPSGDPARLSAEVQANPEQMTDAAITAQVEQVVAALKPLLDAAGVSANPLTASFTVNGEGIDRVLDSLSITITPASATSSNIEIAVKQMVADGEVPPTIQFSSTAAVPTLPAVDASKLVQPGTAPLITAFLQKMTACYALPVASRVASPDANNRPASDIVAPACKELFHNDDPSTFKSNGNQVGSNGAFGNIYRTGGNGLAFDRGTYEFSRTNGDIVAGYRSTAADGSVNQGTFVLRPDNVAAPTKLRQIGNGYDYEGGITAYHQQRSFVNQPQASYLSTGYSFSVANTLDGSNNPIFDRVVVTSPKNTTLVLKPQTGFTLLQLARNGTPTGNAFLRLRGEYLSASRAGENPGTADATLFFTPTPYQDSEIEAFGQRGVWKFDYYLAAAPAILAQTQHYRTRARALSIGELKQQAMAELTSGTLADLAAATGGVGAQSFQAPAGGYPLAWTVGTGALAPTSVAVWGFINGTSPRIGFNDALPVSSVARAASVRCLKKSVADSHCTGSVVNQPSNFVANDRINGMHLWARDAGGREFAHFYATYNIGQ